MSRTEIVAFLASGTLLWGMVLVLDGDEVGGEDSVAVARTTVTETVTDPLATLLGVPDASHATAWSCVASEVVEADLTAMPGFVLSSSANLGTCEHTGWLLRRLLDGDSLALLVPALSEVEAERVCHFLRVERAVEGLLLPLRAEPEVSTAAEGRRLSFVRRAGALVSSDAAPERWERIEAWDGLALWTTLSDGQRGDYPSRRSSP